MIEKLQTVARGSDWMDFRAEPRMTEDIQRRIRLAIERRGNALLHWTRVGEQTLRAHVKGDLSEDVARALINELDGTHEVKLTLEEAGKELSRLLLKYAGQRGWYFVGVSMDALEELFIYTDTRKRANELLSFIGYEYEGYKVKGKMIGKIRPLAKPNC